MAERPVETEEPEQPALTLLVEECLRSIEDEGFAAFPRFLKAHPDHAAGIRSRVERLRELGFLDDPGDLPVVTPLDGWVARRIAQHGADVFESPRPARRWGRRRLATVVIAAALLLTGALAVWMSRVS